MSTLSKLATWDQTLTQRIVDTDLMNHKFAGFFAKSGDFLPWLAFSLICYIFDIIFPRFENLLQITAIAVVGLVIQVLKRIIRRKRPSKEVQRKYVSKLDIWGFPSGHAGRMACSAIMIMLLFPKIGWIILIWAILVGYGRIVIKAHYFLDIFGGSIVGIIGSIILYLLRDKIHYLFTPFIELSDTFLF
jgi:undecaprenyl-diphosphatase